jgi:hypothetical protein
MEFFLGVYMLGVCALLCRAVFSSFGMRIEKDSWRSYKSEFFFPTLVAMKAVGIVAIESDRN